MKEYKKAYPELAQEFDDAINDRYSLDIEKKKKKYPAGHNDATRNTSLETIQEIAKQNPTFFTLHKTLLARNFVCKKNIKFLSFFCYGKSGQISGVLS